MQNTSLIVNMPSWKKPIWIVILLTVLILLVILFVFQRNVGEIDQKLENIQTYESK